MLVVIMSATMMQVLDSTIANVALPEIQGSLSATPDSIGWVLTSYILLSAIMMPITGWLESRVGRRNLFFIGIVGFTASSALCGASATLEMMVASRALQGCFGAFIMPLSQSTLLDNNRPEDRPKVMMIWSLGVMVGPIMGPLLGGWLTDNYGWQWVFLVNLPIGIAVAAGIWFLLPEDQPARRSFDLLGFGLISTALVSFQLLLDRGTQKDWFQSTEIIIEAGIAFCASWMFLVHMLTSKSPVLPRALFRDRNFVVSVALITVITGIMLAGGALTAPMLQHLMNYDALGAGIVMIPRGLGVTLALPLSAFLIRRFDGRLVVGTGLALVALSLWMSTGFDVSMDAQPVIWSGFLQGMGVGLSSLPLNLMAFSTLVPALRTEGAAVYGLARNFGASVAIAILSAMLARNMLTSHSELAAHITTLEFGAIRASPAVAKMVAQMLEGEISRQALMIAYLDNFWVMQWVTIVTLPLLLLMQKSKPAKGAPPITE